MAKKCKFAFLAGHFFKALCIFCLCFAFFLSSPDAQGLQGDSLTEKVDIDELSELLNFIEKESTGHSAQQAQTLKSQQAQSVQSPQAQQAQPLKSPQTQSAQAQSAQPAQQNPQFSLIGGIKIADSPYAQKQIQKYIKQYTTAFGKQQLYDILDNGELYRLYVRQELKKRGMPAALEYLPVVESEYKPMAVSKSGAKGLWQFMDNSIEGLLKKNDFIDERYDPWKSTDAALKKLQDNYRQFKDWPLAIAAYNCGAGAMKKILSGAKEKTFWFIAENGLLRDQSVQYVPKLLAIAELSDNSSTYEIELPKITSSNRCADFDYITTDTQIALDRLSSELKMEPSILKKLNSALLTFATPPKEKYELRLPSGMKKSTEIAIAEITKPTKADKPAQKTPTAPRIVHIVQKGETLWSISKKYGVTVKEIQQKNNLTEGSPLQTGKKLYIN